MIKQKLLFVGYAFTLLGLLFYSFTQIDLSLTVSRVPFLQELVKSFQWIGYFNRPLSTYFFLAILCMLFTFYLVVLSLAAKKKLNKKYVWSLVGVSAVLLTFSYNAFSYDLFNYIFDAKIITHYHANPYIHKALDYPNDPMLSFMRWTHREYPYGPIWLGLTVPLSFVGFQFFIPTFFLFKMLMTAGYIGSVYFIGKIFQRYTPEKELFGILFFGLNPLVLLEGLVSAHIDIVMMCFALWAFSLLLERKHTLSYLSLFLSIGIKFVTGVLLPLVLFIHFLQKKKKQINWESMFGLAILILIGAVIIESLRSNFQPWYLLAIWPFAVFLSHRYFVFIPTVIVSFFALLNYVPFLYTGNWDKPIPQILSDMNFLSYSIAFFTVASYFFYRQIVFARAVKKKK